VEACKQVAILASSPDTASPASSVENSLPQLDDWHSGAGFSKRLLRCGRSR
jgi:hypothetical protein